MDKLRKTGTQGLRMCYNFPAWLEGGLQKREPGHTL